MDYIFIYVILSLFLLGLCLGSFSAATVWRLRARQLVIDKADGEKIDEIEYKSLKPLSKINIKSDYSRCLSCQHRLKWYDLIPLLSWLKTRGKCHYCNNPIGIMEPIAEIGLALFFVVSFLAWPVDINSYISALFFVIWLISGVMLAILFIYDSRWFLLPNQIVYPLIAIGAFSAFFSILLYKNTDFLSLIGSIVILSGIYAVLWKLSNGAWIGFGDVKLGLALALLLGQWQLAFIALFSANLIGCIIVIPGLISGKLKRTTHIPFGPLLIAGYFIAGLWGINIIEWYNFSY